MITILLCQASASRHSLQHDRSTHAFPKHMHTCTHTLYYYQLHSPQKALAALGGVHLHNIYWHIPEIHEGRPASHSPQSAWLRLPIRGLTAVIAFVWVTWIASGLPPRPLTLRPKSRYPIRGQTQYRCRPATNIATDEGRGSIIPAAAPVDLESA